MTLGPNPLEQDRSLLLIQKKGPLLESCQRIRWEVGMNLGNVTYKVACGYAILSDRCTAWIPVGSGCIFSRDEFIQLKNSRCPEDRVKVFCYISVDGLVYVENSTQTRNSGPGSDRLSSDFMQLMLSGENTDVTIRVGNEVFRAHSLILTARAPGFHAMFKNHQETMNGRVSIEDSDPDTFRAFIHYIYTGTVPTISADDVLNLYEVADKYQVDSLKSECVRIMQNTLSADTVCSATILAVRQGDFGLLQSAVVCFSINAANIKMSSAWKNFLSSNPKHAKKLLVCVHWLRDFKKTGMP